MVKVIATNRKPVTVTAKKKDVKVRPCKTDAGGERNSATVDEMRAMRIDKIGKTRGTPDTREGDDAFVRQLASFQNFVKCRENGEVATARAPGRMVGG
jgi:hypothetical protein